MWSSSVIADFARQAAIKALADEIEPYNPGSIEEPTGWGTRFQLPNLGDFRPEGWRLVDSRLVDNTGMDEHGPAMTRRRFIDWVMETVADDPTAGFAVIEVGQFQVVVGYFTQNPEIESGEDPNGIPAEDLEWEECPYCEEPVETEDGGFKENSCPYCERRIAGERDSTQVCPECDEPSPFVDGSQWLECGDCGHTWERVKYKAGTLVDVADPGPDDLWEHAFQGRLDTDYHPGDEYVVVIDQDNAAWDVYEDQITLAYDPATDPNQIKLPLD